MKIFYCAVFDNIGYAADNAKYRELELAGNTVAAYNYRVRGRHYGKEENISSKRDDEIIEFCKTWAPDFIIFSKCNGIDIRVFEELKKIAPLCYWFADPLVTYSHEEFYKKTQVCDFFVCDKFNVLQKAKNYNNNCYLVTDGFDSLLEKPRQLEKKYDVSFIGNLYGDRKEVISKISHKVNVINNAFGEQHSAKVSESKINLNFCTTDGQSDRVFKILAAGGFLLTNDWPDRKDFFEDKKDLVVFRDESHLNDLIKYYLENEHERKRIAEHGNKTVQKYNRKNWVAKVLEIFRSFDFAKRYEKTKESILFAGPWVGEFGWELLCWHGYIRKLSRYYDKTVCVSSKHSEFLYKDFCTQFLVFEDDSKGHKDSYYKNGFQHSGRLISELLKRANVDANKSKVSILLPRRIGDPPRTHFTEKFQFGPLFVAPEYIKMGEKSSKNNNIVIHARDRDLRPEDNWPRQKWNILVKKLTNLGYDVASIGIKKDAMHIAGSIDKRECDSGELLDLLANAKVIFGPSSAPMILGSLCGCPQIVWTTDYNFDRFTKNWNPFNTEVVFLSEYGWQPEPEYVFDKFLEWSKEHNEF